MCGICGFLDTNRDTSESDLKNIISGMSISIQHRGPDADGKWIDQHHGVALGFRRLSILDLSVRGHQPMSSQDGRYKIVFNGEIYNFAALRKQLEKWGHNFLGGSDTEVMLAAFTKWGLVEAIKKFNGQFAFALWDQEEKVLHLVRDRIGVKPIYYGWQRGVFLFASELKAIRAYPGFKAEIDRQALVEFLTYGYVPTPKSIYEGINKLEPGMIFSVDLSTSKGKGSKMRYWNIPIPRDNARGGISELGPKEAILSLESLLLDSVKLRMVSDVPLGAFLSGGIDSSTIVALMQAQSSQSIKTFTIGFADEGFNEAHYAKDVAKYLGTDHTELYVTPAEAMNVVPDLPKIYDEPFADSSQIPTYLVSKLARRDVTVSLSGDGGDELFLGYNRYLWTQKIWRSASWLPTNIRKQLAGALSRFSSNSLESIYRILRPTLPRRLRFPQMIEKFQKVTKLLAMESPQDAYQSLVSFWLPGSNLVKGVPIQRNSGEPSWLNAEDTSFVMKMSHADIRTYLPDDILVKLDRASTATSLEGRVPFIDDHRVVEYALALPTSLKIREGKGKWILREVLKKYIPEEMMDRPKMGFALPIDSWLRGPLQAWAEELLSPGRIEAEGLLNSAPIQEKWLQHKTGKKNWHNHLWNVLMFQAWLEEYS